MCCIIIGRRNNNVPTVLCDVLEKTLELGLVKS